MIFYFRAENIYYFFLLIPAVNAPTRILVPEGQLANEYNIHLKRGRPIDSKVVPPRKRITQMNIGTPEEVHD